MAYEEPLIKQIFRRKMRSLNDRQQTAGHGQQQTCTSTQNYQYPTFFHNSGSTAERIAQLSSVLKLNNNPLVKIEMLSEELFNLKHHKTDPAYPGTPGTPAKRAIGMFRQKISEVRQLSFYNFAQDAAQHIINAEPQASAQLEVQNHVSFVPG